MDRKAAVAGYFYPASAAELRRMISRMVFPKETERKPSPPSPRTPVISIRGRSRERFIRSSRSRARSSCWRRATGRSAQHSRS